MERAARRGVNDGLRHPHFAEISKYEFSKSRAISGKLTRTKYRLSRAALDTARQLPDIWADNERWRTQVSSFMSAAVSMQLERSYTMPRERYSPQTILDILGRG